MTAGVPLSARAMTEQEVLVAVLADQRNRALDALARTTAELAVLAQRLADLEAATAAPETRDADVTRGAR